MTPCPNCGSEILPGRRFCSQCGTAAQPGGSGSVQDGLNKIGIGIGGRQIVGFIVAVVGGLVVARVLPYVYDPVFGRLTSMVVGTKITTLRDNFNVVLMTTVTCLTSFVIAFIAFRKSSRQRKH